MTAPQRLPRQHRLAAANFGVKKGNGALKFDIVQFRREIRNRIVPPDLPVGNDIQPRLHLFRDCQPRHLILRIQQVRGGAVAGAERCNGLLQQLQFGGISDARIAAGAGKIEPRSRGAHQVASELARETARKLVETRKGVKGNG
jgi:hypothetical protein